MKIPNLRRELRVCYVSLARIVSEDSQLAASATRWVAKSSKDS